MKTSKRKNEEGKLFRTALPDRHVFIHFTRYQCQYTRKKIFGEKKEPPAVTLDCDIERFETRERSDPGIALFSELVLDRLWSGQAAGVFG